MDNPDYSRFEFLHRLGSHQLIIPIYVPKVLLREEHQVLAKLQANDISLPKPTVEFSQKEYAHGIEDLLTLTRSWRTEQAQLELVTKFESGSTEHQEGLRNYLPEYRALAGEFFQEELFAPYEQPLSRVSPQTGIYFSPQDTKELALNIKTTDGQYLARVSFKDKTDFYWIPRLSSLFTSNINSKNSLERRMAQYFAHFQDRLPKSNLDNIRNTSEGVDLMNLAINAFVLSRD